MYYDEENRRHLNTIRSAYAELASYLSTKNRKEDARKILNKVDKGMLEENFALLPQRFQLLFPHMKQHDWLFNYQNKLVYKQLIWLFL